MAELETNRQNAPFSCFINCYGMVRSSLDKEYEFTEEEEFQLMEESFRFDRECYEPYLISRLKDSFDVTVLVESEYLLWKYRQLSNSDKIENSIDPEHRIMSVEAYREAVEEGMAIVLLDKWFIDMYTHFAHWAVISDFDDGSFIINDSWTGREIRMSEDKFEKAVESLRERLRCSPVLIKVVE